MTRISMTMSFAALACGLWIGEYVDTAFLTIGSILGASIVLVIVESILEVIIARRRRTDG